MENGGAQDAVNTVLPTALHSQKSSTRLKQIAALRASGIGDLVDLPQLVVCGDQSAGKSSVLEGITNLPFPRQDGVCTRFPTELILENTDEPSLSILATIIPSQLWEPSTKAELASFERRLSDLTELPKIINEVGCLLEIRGFGDNKAGPAFTDDILRIRVSGPTGLHLTVVDLPGLISVPSEEQTEEDMATVHRMVDTYAANPRTIILAVVQAGNDIANQQIIQKSRRFDKQGRRTVGIITKPDLINQGTEKRIALLARNEDSTKLKLGFFLLKNPTPNEMAQGISASQRRVNELRFFNTSPWMEQGLNAAHVGIAALTAFLQKLLDEHIQNELPKVRDEVKQMLARKEQEMREIGEGRPTISEMRMFLSALSMKFYAVVSAALNGNYHGADPQIFVEDTAESSAMRLRALVHRLNTEYSNLMREYGQKRKVVSASRGFEKWAKPAQEASSRGFGDWPTPPARPVEDSPQALGEPCSESEERQRDRQILVTEAQMKGWVEQMYVKTRGRELPGNFNPSLLSELYLQQSSRWQGMAEDHLSNVHDRVREFIRRTVNFVVLDNRIRAELFDAIDEFLQEAKCSGLEELHKLCEDERQQPITYNHYYTDNVQNARQQDTRGLIKKAIKKASMEDAPSGKNLFGNATNNVNGETLLASLEKGVIVNMDEQACSEALACLDAYYKVARKTFVDNVCKQVIERHLLRNLAECFSPEKVASYTDDELQRIAAESPDDVEKRENLKQLCKTLRETLQELRK